MSHSAVRTRHYLNRTPSNMDRRKDYRRTTKLLVRTLFPVNGIRRFTTRTCLMVDISEGGTKLEVGPSSTIPDHFYIVFGQFDFLVGCSVVERESGYLHVAFLTRLSPRFVNRISRLTSSEATLEPLGREFEEFKTAS